MLINIVSSRRLVQYEGHVIKDLSPPSPAPSSCEKSLTQAVARCIVKCEGSVQEEGQSFVMNAYDCFGETTLMSAAVVNDMHLLRFAFHSAHDPFV